VRPVAGPARLRRRHRGLLLSVLLTVVVPFLLTVVYLTVLAKDQYASTTGFTVRTEETSSASDLLGGIGAFVGGGAGGNGNVLNAFMQSQEIVERVMARLDLVGHYSRDWPADPVFSLWPDATIEDVLWFWKRMVRITFDAATGLMDVQVRARDPQMARDISMAIVAESEAMINALNEQARRDSMANAQRDLESSLARLRATREALAAFRVRTQIVDPQADIQGRMGVINNLQQQLAQALVDHDLLLQVTSETDPRVRQAMRRIEVINARIDEERRTFVNQDVTVFDTDYPRLIAQFESLRVDQDFAEQTYRAALTSLDAARSNAARQSLYLATYIRPTLAERAQYPERLKLSLLSLGFLVLIWSIVSLVYYSLRDRG
jgi:capsular polysaccharide transport system permease protein